MVSLLRILAGKVTLKPDKLRRLLSAVDQSNS
jgi:hypothetical protein